MKDRRLGSTRIMTSVEPGVIQLLYTDMWSAFDRGSSRQSIPTIGPSRCACAAESFKIAAHLPTHYVRQVSAIAIHVMEFAVPGRESLSGKVHGRVLPLEWIWRIRVKGSLYSRLKEGKIDPAVLGFKPGIEIIEGMMLPKMLLECTTKFEPVDRHLSDEEARTLADLTPSQWGQAWDLVEAAVAETSNAYSAAGFDTPDGKLELGITNGGEIVLVDVFGTQDENRIIDKVTGDLYSKDLIRNYLAGLPWKAELDAAKKEHPGDKTSWPEYPTLPQEIVQVVSARYAQVAERYAGVTI